MNKPEPMSDDTPINFGVALDTVHPLCHQAADAFWRYWNENGETHKRGYYESTWGAINQAIRLVGVKPWNYGAKVPPFTEPATEARREAILALLETICAEGRAMAARLEEAERDAGRLDWMSEHEACIRWNREGDLCGVWVRTDDEEYHEFELVCKCGRAFNTAREAIDAARACLAKNARSAITKEQP